MLYGGWSSFSSPNYFDLITGKFPWKGIPSAHVGPALGGSSADFIMKLTLPLSKGFYSLIYLQVECNAET